MKVCIKEKKVTKIINENFSSKLLGAMLIEYPPNKTYMGEHYHEKRESMYIGLEGSAVMRVNGVEHSLESGTIVFLSPGMVHGIVSIGEMGFRMLEVWSPLDQDRINIGV